MTAEITAQDTSAENLAIRLFGAALGSMDLLHIYVGDKLGLYSILASSSDGLTPRELASRGSMQQRYAREWLEQQAVAGILSVEEVSAEPDSRRYRLPSGHAEALTDEKSMSYLAPVAGMLVAIAQQMPRLLARYPTGEGLEWAAYGDDMWKGQAALNRPLFEQMLGQQYLPAIPEVDAMLRQPDSRVADLACGGGWSSIAIARAYPNVKVDGYDQDEPSIKQAADAAVAAGLTDRVHFSVADAAAMSGTGQSYNLVTIFEALHDVSDPVGVLSASLRMLREGGLMLVMDERVADEFTAPGDDIERFMYGWSLTVCLPGGLSEHPSAGTGTVMRRSTLEGYAHQAGFSAVEVLPIENDFFRFYLLRA